MTTASRSPEHLVWRGFLTLLRRENERTFRVWSQTFLPPVISAILFVVIFGRVVGRQAGGVDNLPYLDFLIPGMVIMNVMLNAYGGAAFTVFFAKWERYVQDILVSPMSYLAMVLAILLGGGIVRGVLTGVIVYAALAVFSIAPIAHPLTALFFLLTTSVLFSSFGMVMGLWAERFDHFNIVQTFVLTPLIYLGGVFYSLKTLPDVVAQLSRFNPLFYMIDGFRYGMTGFRDGNVWIGAVMVSILTVATFLWCVVLFRRGYKLRT